MKFGLHNMWFNASTGNVRDVWPETRDRAQWAEGNGFAYFTLMDHLMQMSAIGPVESPFLESWTTLGALAATTERIGLATMVSSVAYRNPALLAKMATTLDLISGGRAILGIGGGWYEAEYRGYNYDFPRPGVRLAQLREGIRLIKTMWREPRATFQGKHFAVREAVMEPKPLRSSGMPVLIGGTGEKVTLRIMAEEADIVNFIHGGGGPAFVAAKSAVLEAHCKAIRRDFRSIEVTTIESVVLAATTRKALDTFKALGGNLDAPWKGLVGTPDEVVKLIRHYESIGVHGLMLRFPGYDRESMALFAKEVLPAFR